jgi:transposase
VVARDPAAVSGESKPIQLHIPSARRASWWVLRPVAKREPQQHNFVEKLCKGSEEINGAVQLASEFAQMVRQREPDGFEGWLSRAGQDKSLEIRGFATSLRQDQAAVAAGLKMPWSTGPVEGQINRLKTIKRQMYGRANFDLLRQRVLHAA